MLCHVFGVLIHVLVSPCAVSVILSIKTVVLYILCIMNQCNRMLK
jgi:hypothetical protein